MDVELRRRWHIIIILKDRLILNADDCRYNWLSSRMYLLYLYELCLFLLGNILRKIINMSFFSIFFLLILLYSYLLFWIYLHILILYSSIIWFISLILIFQFTLITILLIYLTLLIRYFLRINAWLLFYCWNWYIWYLFSFLLLFEVKAFYWASRAMFTVIHIELIQHTPASSFSH